MSELPSRRDRLRTTPAPNGDHPTTITLSQAALTGGVANGAGITFGVPAHEGWLALALATLLLMAVIAIRVVAVISTGLSRRTAPSSTMRSIGAPVAGSVS